MKRLERVGQERAQHEEAPHAVDDRGDAGEQFDGQADRTAQPERTDLGQEHRDAETDGNGDHHRDHGGDQRAVDRTERAEHRRIGRRRPALRPQEGEAVFPHRGPGADDQREDDAAEDEQNRDRAGAGDPVEGDVAELESAEGPGAIVRSGSFHRVALNRHVCHANPLSTLAQLAANRTRLAAAQYLPLASGAVVFAAPVGRGSVQPGRTGLRARIRVREQRRLSS